jgi:acid phosphatase (class A)
VADPFLTLRREATRREQLQRLGAWAVALGGPMAAAAQNPASAPALTTAPTVPAAPPAAPPTHYIGPDAIDLRAVLPPWPAEGSLGAAADLATVFNVQAARSLDDERAAREDGERGPAEWLAAGLGAGFARRAAPVLVGPLAGARSDFGRYAHRSPWPARPRPLQRDARVKALFPVHAHSYPSARTAATRIWAEILAEVFAAEREQLVALAERSAWLRVVAGVHDPSDLEGGRRVALAFVAALRASPSYRADLDAARRAALG